MSTPDLTKGSFTLPGEAGHEELTLRLAQRWGADTIRDSDGTQLSPAITRAGYEIYSTICLVRSVNAWARQHPERLQQNFLMSFPVVAERATVTIDLLRGFFREQFAVNLRDDPRRWWQVFDRTTGKEVPRTRWSVRPRRGAVTIRDAVPGHQYTVNFLATRLWEEISMYNHLTNHWGDREHLAAVDPIYPDTQAVLLAYLEQWLAEHPDTTVVRFTSMFYNFSWFWGDDPNLRYVYSDWGDYAMTVSPRALRLFARRYGYALASEDFVNGGLYNSTHNAPSRRYRDYMEFVHDTVIGFGRRCVDLVHRAGKKAFVFYDDHWIGVEPNSPRFAEFGFDGLIKCVFNAFEVRLCARAQGVRTHELRLHPYLFPTGLQGEPTFQAGGDPAGEARRFWVDVRRGLLRAPIDRIGLGGYLSLVEPFPDFVDAIEQIAGEFRLLKSLHDGDRPYTAPFKVAILTAWGAVRAWTCSGHFTPGVELNELLESLAGLPVEVGFLDFDELRRRGVPPDVQVVINCGREGGAWSGGSYWHDAAATVRLTRWVHRGGGLIGIAEPSAGPAKGRSFKLAPVLGLDRDRGERLANGRYRYAVAPATGGGAAAGVAPHFVTADLTSVPDFGRDVDGIYVLGRDTEVLAERAGSPCLAVHPFGRGRSVYLSGFKFAPENTRLLHRALAWAAGDEAGFAPWSCSNLQTECAWFPGSRKLVVVNHAAEPQGTRVTLADGETVQHVTLDGRGLKVLDL